MTMTGVISEGRSPKKFPFCAQRVRYNPIHAPPRNPACVGRGTRLGRRRDSTRKEPGDLRRDGGKREARDTQDRPAVREVRVYETTGGCEGRTARRRERGE